MWWRGASWYVAVAVGPATFFFQKVGDAELVRGDAAALGLLAAPLTPRRSHSRSPSQLGKAHPGGAAGLLLVSESRGVPPRVCLHRCSVLVSGRLMLSPSLFFFFLVSRSLSPFVALLSSRLSLFGVSCVTVSGGIFTTLALRQGTCCPREG